MLKLNREEIKDKIYACWIGKNIGGTIGGPYEGRQEILNIKGFSTPSGEPLPNDDLDLQLVWLTVTETHGPFKLNAQLLGEYWLHYVTAHWSEYGICKSNMKSGLLPPLCGEYENHEWRNSNGAWIRSEIWACMAPGCPDIAIKYALEDACVDHGMGEGTYAEIFTAALESAAFIVNDVRELIDIGLSKIPSDCRLAKSIKMTIDCYDKGVDWKDTRNMLVEDSKDLGWFQAPANVAFVILGMLYGEGDFKRSMLYAVNCGDDTDCTAATLGSIFGIMYGTKCIPQDWKDHIGDAIVSLAIDRTSGGFAKTCTELTNRVFDMIPVMLKANRANVSLCDETSFDDDYIASLKDDKVARKICDRSGYSYDIDFIYASARVEFDGKPHISPLGDIDVKIRFFNKLPDAKHLQLRLILPEGWSAKYSRNAFIRHQGFESDPWVATITAGENVDAVNRIIIEATVQGRLTVGLIPVTILG